MATRSDLWSTTTPKRRITTYSKHFKRKPQKEEVGLNGRISTAPVESSVWDFHGDEDEISSPAVTLDKLKQKRPQHNRMRTISEMTPQRNPTAAATSAVAVPRAIGAIVNPKKRRASLMGKEKAGTDGRAFSTPPSPPSSTEDRMPPPKTIPLPKPIKAPKTTQRRTSSLGSRSSPTAETISQTKTSLPFTFRAGKSVNDLTGKSVHDISHRLGHRKSLTQTHIPYRPVAAPRPPARLLPMTRPEKASSSRMSLGATLNQTAPRKKRRLIDELAAQANESSSEEEEGASASQVTRRTPTPEPQGLSVVPQTPEPSRNRTYGRPGSAKKTGPKFTYSARRTIRTESSLSESQDSVDEMSWLRESILPSIPSQFDMDEEEEEEPFTKGAVRSIHELRQAGANSRSADEIDDLLTRIGRPSGKPSSSRRNALIELSQKMQDKAFVRKFRDHNGDRSLFEQIGKETDIISGYALVAILTTLMATTASTHIVSQLEGQGFAVLLRRLFHFSVDIQTLARDRASNLSRNGQQSMTKLKASLLILPVWAPTTPFMLSPRRLALKALELVVKNTGSVGDEFFSTEVTNYLFALLKNAPVPDAWAFPHSDESIDFQLALTLLEAHSMQAMQSEARERWTFTHMPVLADTLKSTLRQCNTRFGEVGMLVLKLALNTSNNNHDAPAAFIEKGTVRVLANALCDTFLAATNSVYNADTFTAFLEPVLVMSGIMINFSENDRATSKSLLLPSKSGQTALDRLITLFLDHHAATAEADSVEKSQLNVAFGYLSLLLGYMSLYEPVRQRFSAMHKAGNVDPLISSIREFIIYYRAVDSSIAEDGVEQSSQHSNFATKLQGLVERLEGYR